MKTITVTVRLPDWANWLAQDGNGRWMAYENKPIWDVEWWIPEDGKMESIYLGDITKHPADTLTNIKELLER